MMIKNHLIVVMLAKIKIYLMKIWGIIFGADFDPCRDFNILFFLHFIQFYKFLYFIIHKWRISLRFNFFKLNNTMLDHFFFWNYHFPYFVVCVLYIITNHKIPLMFEINKCSPIWSYGSQK
jgi:hypothetical protein